MIKVETQTSHIEHWEIKELCRPIKNLLSGLSENINNGDYVALLGEDTSGRIPALILRRVMGGIYQEKGFAPPETMFFTSYLYLPVNQREGILKEFEDYLRDTGIPKKAGGEKGADSN